jgi:DNA adenine methylase
MEKIHVKMIMNQIQTCMPLVKWAGGKRQIMNQLLSLFPKTFHNYYEPFAGGLSVFLRLYNRGTNAPASVAPTRFFLSDINSALMSMYTVVKDHPVELIEQLRKMSVDTLTREKYLCHRTEFNTLKRKDYKSVGFVCVIK